MSQVKDKVKREITPQQALNRLMGLCSRSEKCSSDALRLMRNWGLPGGQAEEVLEKLRSDRYIDDARYADCYVREKTALSGWGPYKIRQALSAKNIPRPVIESMIEKYTQQDGDARLEELLKRKLASIRDTDPYKVKAKLVRFAVGRGFAISQAVDAADRLIKVTDD